MTTTTASRGTDAASALVQSGLALLTTFDYISPALAVVENMLYGPARVFAIPYAAGWIVGQIEAEFAARGLPLWGRMMIDQCFVFSVREEDAQLVEARL